MPILSASDTKILRPQARERIGSTRLKGESGSCLNVRATEAAEDGAIHDGGSSQGLSCWGSYSAVHRDRCSGCDNRCRLPWTPNAGAPPRPFKLGPWEFFTGDEGRAMEALADTIIPSDAQAP